MRDSLAHAYDFLEDVEEYEDELQHFGVKGMKWGKRKASAQALVTKRGGKKGGAIAAEVGKVAAINLASNMLGGVALNTIGRSNPAVRAGILAATAAIQTGALIGGVSNVAAIAKADKDA